MSIIPIFLLLTVVQFSSSLPRENLHYAPEFRHSSKHSGGNPLSNLINAGLNLSTHVVKDVADGAKEIVSSGAKAVGNVVKGVETVVDTGSDVIGDIINGKHEVGKVIASLFNGTENFGKEIFNAKKTVGKILIGALAEIGFDLVNGTKMTVSEALQLLHNGKSFKSIIVSVAVKVLKDSVNATVDVAKDVYESKEEIVTGVISAFRKVITEAIKENSESTQSGEVFTKLTKKEIMEQAFKLKKELITEIMAVIKSALESQSTDDAETIENTKVKTKIIAFFSAAISEVVSHSLNSTAGPDTTSEDIDGTVAISTSAVLELINDSTQNLAGKTDDASFQLIIENFISKTFGKNHFKLATTTETPITVE